jgi:hypothetical protein
MVDSSKKIPWIFLTYLVWSIFLIIGFLREEVYKLL